MYFSKNFEENTKKDIIQCTNMHNSILAQKIKINTGNELVRLEENQSAILFENGRIYDYINIAGDYKIEQR